jgi:Aminotransferase class-V
MATRLYLDTARLGQMSRGAQLAHIDFARWAGEEAGSLYFDEFLRHGFATLPPALQDRYSGLASWRGIADLKQDLAALAGVESGTRVLLANRSSQLLEFAARLLCSRCRSVLVTDLSWPAYDEILETEKRKAGVRLWRVDARDVTLEGKISVAGFVNDIADLYCRHRCDGLFLPAVDNCGIRLPVDEIAREIRRRAELRFFVVDAAQAFCHVPLDGLVGECDFLIAGCHKWLRAYHPLGIGFFGRVETRSYIDLTLRRLLPSRKADDPLLAFTEQWERGRPSPFGETVNLAPLFSCSGAVADAIASENRVEDVLSVRIANARQFADVARRAGWDVLEPQPGFRCGIVLLQCPAVPVWGLPPQTLRERFLEQGLAVTTYKFGRVRFSMPDRPWQPDELSLVETALNPDLLAPRIPISELLKTA